MDLKQTKALLKEIESNFPVGTWEVNGLLIWPFLRINIISRLSQDEFQTPHAKKKIIPHIIKITAFYFGSYFHNWKINSYKKKDVIFLDDGISRNHFGKYDFFTVIDPLRYFFEKKGLTATVISRGYSYNKDSLAKITLIQSIIDCASISSRIKKITNTKYDYKLTAYEDFVNFWKQKNISIPIWSIKELVHFSRLIQSLVKSYTKILIKINPKLAFINCYYDLNNMAFIHACSKLGIKTFDIQHGVAGNMNPAYSSWLNVPKKGYSFLPDYFLSWEKNDSEAINLWSSELPKHKGIYIGNLFIDCFKAPNITGIDIMSYLKLNKKDFELNKKKKAILITLSWGMDLRKEYDEIFKFVNLSQHHYHFFIRLHPVMIGREEEIEYMLREDYGITNFDIDKATNTPLYFLLPQIDVHITYASAAAIEAMHFGVGTVITSIYGFECLRDSLLPVYNKVALNALDIQSSVKEFLDNKTTNTTYNQQDIEIKKKNLYDILTLVDFQ